MRTSIARLAAGTLVVLVACTGTPSSAFTVRRSDRLDVRPAFDLRDRQTRERAAASRRMPHGNRRSGRDRGVRGGRQRVGPRPGERRHQLPVRGAGPGPVHVEPSRGSSTVERPRDPGRSTACSCGPPRRRPAAVTSWGHPIGKAVVYISPSGTRLRKVYPGTQRRDDITPVAHVHYLNVIYHPSGLAIAFVIDTGDGEEIWLSSNLGEDPVRLVFAVGGTRFGALDFTADGTTLLYAAVHGDDAPILHAIDLTDPTINQGLWHGDAGDRISAIAAQPEPGWRPDRADGRCDVRGLEGDGVPAGRATSAARWTRHPGSSAGSTTARSWWRPTDATDLRTWSRSTAGSPSRYHSSRGSRSPRLGHRSPTSCRRSRRASRRRSAAASGDERDGGRSAAGARQGSDQQDRTSGGGTDRTRLAFASIASSAWARSSGTWPSRG